MHSSVFVFSSCRRFPTNICLDLRRSLRRSVFFGVCLPPLSSLPFDRGFRPTRFPSLRACFEHIVLLPLSADLFFAARKSDRKLCASRTHRLALLCVVDSVSMFRIFSACLVRCSFVASSSFSILFFSRFFEAAAPPSLALFRHIGRR